MPSDLTPERRRFLEILARHPDGAPAKAIPADVPGTVREWCKENFLAQFIRNGRDLAYWRITEFGRAALRDPEARP